MVGLQKWFQTFNCRLDNYLQGMLDVLLDEVLNISQVYDKALDLSFSQGNVTNSKTLQQSASIYSKSFTCLPFIYLSFLYLRLQYPRYLLQYFQRNLEKVIFTLYFAISAFELRHILPSLHQLFLILRQRFQKYRILHFIL